MLNLWVGKRRQWVAAQAVLGVGNAFSMMFDWDRGNTVAAVFSAICVLITASWALPAATPPDKK